MAQAPFQLFDALDPATEAALRASIERFGVLVPIAVDQHGNVLDGHHRQRIADELGLKPHYNTIVIDDEDEGRAIAFTLNADRRQLTQEQRREVVAVLAAETVRINGEDVGRHSPEAIADALGVDRKTVRNDLADLAEVGTGPNLPDKRVGKDGKVYPSKRQKPVIQNKDKREQERTSDALANLPLDSLPSKPLDTKRVERIAREVEAERRRAEPAEPVTRTSDGDIELHHGDFRETLGYLAGTVDAIITDPPYPGEFVHLFADLGAMASLILKPGGLLIAMTGQTYLPQYLDLLSIGLNYRWTGCYQIPGQRNRNHGARVATGWKPLLIFQNDGGDTPEFILDDVFSSDGDDKAHHHWGQSESGMAAIVERCTKPGQLIVDPFLGGGTTAVVCRDLGRRFVGCDIDAAAVRTARERMT